ncbi:MAG TPA: DinB family protein [Ferruginibacter sp.]|nr:DinB family protein [Ferruginibacter sp.]
MKNNERFLKLITDHYNGEPWLDISFKTTIANVSSNDAVKNIAGLNSIWQIVVHLTEWRLTFLKRLNNKLAPAPSDNFFNSISNCSEEAWIQVKKNYENSQKKIISHLLKHNNRQWDQKPAAGSYSHFELLNGVLQHDAYHLGQIVIIKKMLAQV